MAGPKPVLNAMLVCDTVITDRNTGKNSLIGVFEDVRAQSLPIRIGIAVYAKVTDAEGEYVFKLKLVNQENETVIAEPQMPPFRIGDRRKAHELIFTIGNLVFNSEGRYEFQLFADDDFIGLKSFDVQILNQQGGSPP